MNSNNFLNEITLEDKYKKAVSDAAAAKAKVGNLWWKILQAVLSIVMIVLGSTGEYELAIAPGSGSGVLVLAGIVWFIWDIISLARHSSLKEEALWFEQKRDSVKNELDKAKS